MIDRINKIIEANNMSTTQFADSINIQRPSMSHIIAGRNNPSLDFVAKVLKAFPNINPDWLIFGDGKMYRTNAEEKNNSNMNLNKEISNFETSNELDLFSSSIMTIQNNENSKIVNEDNKMEDYVPKIKNNDFKATKSDLELNISKESSDTNKKIDSKEVDNPAKEYSNPRKISKIVFFYQDKTFSEYFPEI